MSAKTDLFDAIRQGDLGRVQSLLDADPALASAKNESAVSAILSSVYFGRTEIRDLLLARGATLGLQDAAAVGRLDRVRELVGKNTALAKSYSSDGFPIVALAAFLGHAQVACYLKEQGADINAIATNGSGYNALSGAVTGGHAEIVQWLLESGADANYRYGPGYSPLLAAAANGHLDIVKLLLTHGADPSAKANDGKSALALAEERKHTSVAEFLKTI
jgi:ankyrin repeat protein